MNNSVRRGAAGLVVGVAVVGLVAGCGDREVKKSDIESQVKHEITEKAKAQNADLKVGTATCDGALKAKVKAHTNCTVEINGKKQKYTATVTSVDGGTVNYSVTDRK